jgi:hypothetical protein
MRLRWSRLGSSGVMGRDLPAACHVGELEQQAGGDGQGGERAGHH